jgi:hypothetical protein
MERSNHAYRRAEIIKQRDRHERNTYLGHFLASLFIMGGSVDFGIAVHTLATDPKANAPRSYTAEAVVGVIFEGTALVELAIAASSSRRAAALDQALASDYLTNE